MKCINTFIHTAALCAVFAAIFSESAAAGSFSGFAGIKGDFSLANESSSAADPDLKLQTFFAGQFNFTDNLITRAEFSLSTGDLIENSIFSKTDSQFQIDELSFIYRKQFIGATNYLSLFMGTYEPIGSDIFLQRQFGIDPVSSKITESWLGLAGSVVYPLFGMGISDVIHFIDQPAAVGIYGYFNHEADSSYVPNLDMRYACVYPYFALDIACGIGAPIKDTYGDEKVILLVDTLYAHGGINMLAGNNYTPFSFFMQGGVHGVPLQRGMTSFSADTDTIYLLAEPRFRFSSFQMRWTLFSLPSETVENLLFIRDTFGLNILFYSDTLYLGTKLVTFGINGTYSFPGKSFLALGNIKGLVTGTFRITFSPYLEMKFFSGDLHTMLQICATDFTSEKILSAFKLNVGYKTQL